jgi:hypothetical protein
LIRPGPGWKPEVAAAAKGTAIGIASAGLAPAKNAEVIMIAAAVVTKTDLIDIMFSVASRPRFVLHSPCRALETDIRDLQEDERAKCRAGHKLC